MEVVVGDDLSAVDFDDDVAAVGDSEAVVDDDGKHLRRSCGAARVDADDDNALHAELAGDHGVDSLVGYRDADDGPTDFAVGDELRDDAIDGVDGDGEGDAGGLIGAACDSGVHADEPAGGVEKRSARVAGVDGGVGLNNVFDGQFSERHDSPAQRADDAGGERLIEPERIADGHHRLADLQVIARAQWNGAELGSGKVDLEDGQVLVGCGADESGVECGLIAKRDSRGNFDAVSAAAQAREHDVVIRDDVSFLVPDEARSCAGGDFIDDVSEDVGPRGQRGDEDDGRGERFVLRDPLHLVGRQGRANQDLPRLDRLGGDRKDRRVRDPLAQQNAQCQHAQQHRDRPGGRRTRRSCRSRHLPMIARPEGGTPHRVKPRRLKTLPRPAVHHV